MESPRETVKPTSRPTWPTRLLTRLKTLKGTIVAIAGVGAVLGGLAGYWNAYQAARAGAQSASLLAIVGKGDAGPLSIVVLPFANLTGDPQQAYLADGITAAVTADLSRIRDAFIVSTATAFAYRDKAFTVQQIGKELGVRFALQGSVQRSGEQIRISAQLADTTTGGQLWSESFEGNLGELFALQEMVTTRLGNSIGREMVVVAARDSERQRGDPRAADLMMRANALALRPIALAPYQEAQTLYRQALLLEPNNARALAGLAASLSVPAANGLIADARIREEQLVEARDLALKAKALDPSLPGIYVTLSDYADTHGDYEGARRASETALSLEPKNPWRYSNLASDYLMAGDPKRAIELLAKAITLDPRRVPDGALLNMGAAQFMIGDDDAATEWLLRTLDKNTDLTVTYALLAMAYARKGDHVRSRNAAATMLRADPNYKLSSFEMRKIEGFPSAYQEWWKVKLLPAWRLAHLAE